MDLGMNSDFSLDLNGSKYNEKKEKKNTSIQEINKSLIEASQKSELRKNAFKKSFFQSSFDISNVLNQTKQEFETSNFWEDFGVSKNDNRFKELSIASCGLLTVRTCRQVAESIQKHNQSLLSDQIIVVEEKEIIRKIIMMLYGISSDIFQVDEFDLVFTVRKMPYATKNISNVSLFCYLEHFVEAGQLSLRLHKLIEFGKNKISQKTSQSLLLHIIEQFLSNLSCNLIQISNEVKILLELEPLLRDNLRELRIFYDMAFCSLNPDDFFSIQSAWESFPNSNELIDYVFHIFSTLEPSSTDSAIFRYVFLTVSGPFLNIISDMLFRGTINSEHRSELFIDEVKSDNEDELKNFDESKNKNPLKNNEDSKNKDGTKKKSETRNFDDNKDKTESKKSKIKEYSIEEANVKKLPTFLKNSVSELIKCANNLLILKESDAKLFELCRDNNLNLELLVDYRELMAYETKINEIFTGRFEMLSAMQKENQVSRELHKVETLKKQLDHLAKIKQNLRKKIDTEDQLRIEILKKKEQERKIIKEQIELKQVREKYRVLLEKEMEKSLILEEGEKIQLENQKEKEAIRKKWEKDSDINKLMKEEKVEPSESEIRKKTEEKMAIEGEATEKVAIDIALLEEKIAEENKVDNQENDRTPQNEEQKPPDELALVEVQNLNNMNSYFENNKEILQLEDQLINKLDSLGIKEDRGRLSSQPEGMLNNNQLIVEEPPINNSNESQPAQPKQSDPADKKIDQAGQDFQIFDNKTVPISVALNISINKVIQLQTALTSKAILHILFEKFHFFETFKFLKSFLLCEKGDLIENFINDLFKKNNEVNWNSVLSCSNLFEESEIEECVMAYGPLFFIKKLNFKQYNSILTFQFSEFVEFKFGKAPNIIDYIFSSECLGIYTSIFSYLLKFRYLALLVRTKWLDLNKLLSVQDSKSEIIKAARILRFKFQYFMDNFMNYIYATAIEGSCKQFLEICLKVESIQELRKAHELFLLKLQKRIFLKTSLRNIEECLNSITSLIIEFNGIINNMVNFVSVLNSKMELAKLKKIGEELKTYASFIKGFKLKKNKNSKQEFLENIQARVKENKESVISGIY